MFANALTSSLKLQTSISLARIAIVLERYLFSEGHYPGSLDFLSPKLLDEAPVDLAF